MPMKKPFSLASPQSITKSPQLRSILGLFFVLLSVFFFIACISFFYHWKADQSLLEGIYTGDIPAQNILGVLGAKIGDIFIYKTFGISGFMLIWLFLRLGVFLIFRTSFIKFLKHFNTVLLFVIWLCTCLGFFNGDFKMLSGGIGIALNEFLSFYLGKVGLVILLIFSGLSYIVVRFNLQLDYFFQKIFYKLKNKPFPQKQMTEEIPEMAEETAETVEKTAEEPLQKQEKNATPSSETEKATEKQVNIALEKLKEEEKTTKNLSDTLVDKFGAFDPTLDLSNYKFPNFDLLKSYNEQIAIDSHELEQNKNRIVETLKNYKIGINEIKATVGPTVTLYEIIPQAGIRISKIKNLEDDIALSLSALGIRIIAPIPGKGTIGIEVPNSKPTMVSMRSVIASKKFQEAEMNLPLSLGKTISNETFVVDLAKMPHLLMAGATGQGKSVGLNIILTSILYKKHPAEVKFILVDPKKVELTLFNKIERHYLAKLPDTEEAIITDTSKVIDTLNSLCIEMENRYELLKTAMVRNISEYNDKFKLRQLNPENGHTFLPYIILVIDEFSDLIMTAGKDIETPIARLAQLARAIGIHLIVATQRPSVNVITGIIKANFPTRIAFRVTSKIDSRTILDASGADQLIGKGDMLYKSGGSDIVRIQCAFVDTTEVEKITNFIGNQRAYPQAYLLPEYHSEENSETLDISKEERDPLFVEAAQIIVTAQQGSTSLLQRKLKLGYNRAGRLIDQLESAGIIGPFEGSKARQVLIPDLASLDTFLANE